MATHEGKRFGRVGSLFAVAAISLSACQHDAPSRVVVNAPGTTATWRVVVWGAGDARDARIAAAIGQQLLSRDLAASLVEGAGRADHVLQVTASPMVFPAQEIIRDGRDTRLLMQATYRTDTPAATVETDASSDPTRALAVTIALRIAADPRFALRPASKSVRQKPAARP